MKLNKIIIGTLILTVFTILISSSVLAFAVSSAYWSENPLGISRGETKDFQLTLQNLAGSEDVNTKASITKGSEIISLVDDSDEYLVPLGEKTKVNLRVNIPNSAEIGGVYPVEITFTTITKSESGALGMGSSIKQSFNVIVIQTVEEAELAQEKVISTKTLWILGIIAAIVIIVIIIILIKRKFRKD